MSKRPGHSFSNRVAQMLGALILLSSSLIVHGQTTPSQPANDERKESAITGRVTTHEGEALPFASVAVSRMGVNAPPELVRVDNSGNFKTNDLSPGLYRVSAFVPGYILEAQPNTPAPGFYHPGDSVAMTMIKGGVITGTVKTSNDAPVVAATVRAIRVRDQNGKAIPFIVANRERLTDDRGIYRIYGLPPGAYVVSVGGPARFTGGTPATAYENDVPTYSPSSTRDTAAEVTINNGDEVTMDIQYRGEAGHIVSGTVAGAPVNSGLVTLSASVVLTDVRTRSQVAFSSTNSFNNFSFSLNGLPDGEYEVYASQGSFNRETLSLASPPKRIKVQGADVTGITLSMTPLASIEGRVVLEPDPKNACGKRRAAAVVETVVYARRFEPDAKPAPKPAQPAEVPITFTNFISEGVVDAKGNFTFRDVRPGTYRIDPREPGSGWFVKSINVEPAARGANVPRDGVPVKAARVSGLVVTMSEGAAKLSGKISLGEKQSLAAGVRAYLVPSESANAENVLRFYEARPDSAGNFVLDNIAPGKYWVVARLSEETELGATKSIRQDATFRAKVLHDAEALKKEMAFKPCEQTPEYELAYTPPTSPQ